MTEHISVRAFVSFLLKEGDIDNRVRASAESAMREGGRLHRRIQRMRGPLYRAEVPLSYSYDTGRYVLTIDGRADGILAQGASPAEETDVQLSFFDGEKDADRSWEDTPLIEEIKGTYRNVARMEAPVREHLAQAYCYAYFYCLQEGCERVRILMTYCNLDTDALRHFTTRHTLSELEEWFSEMRTRYLVWSDLVYDWEKERTASIRALSFPYPYREGQKELAEALYRTIVHEKNLFLQAPTGSGKTLATLYPSIKAIGEHKASRLFYLTARTITRTAPEEALKIMRGAGGLRFKSVTITAKEKICCNTVCDCNPSACPFAKGHYDRVTEAVYDLLCHETCYDRETILSYAKKHTVCPFEYQLDISEFADCVICDYNYLFDPFVYLRRFFADGEDTDNLFLIDEAHNLVERGRSMYSAYLSEGELKGYLSLTQKVKRLSAVHEALFALCVQMERLEADFPIPAQGGGADAYTIVDTCDALWNAIRELSRRLSDYLDSRSERLPRREEMLELHFMLFRFRTIYEGMDHRYTMYARRERTALARGASYVLHLFCVDPSGNLRKSLDKGVSATLFSATMLPVQYYKRLLGGSAEDYEVYARTSFSPERCAHLIVNDVTSRYTERGSASYEKIAHAITEITGARRGNYLVFFPSFKFLEEVRERLAETDEADRLLVQTQEMTEEAREAFLAAFSGDDSADGVTGLCVLGGIFSEGIDLKGSALIGAVIVGTGLPLLTASRGVLSAYFDEAGENGFDFAYRFPGMNRVLQAAGRVIRTESDTGVVALLDDRFAQNGYRSLFPREWTQVPALGTDKVRQHLTDFWKRWEETS